MIEHDPSLPLVLWEAFLPPWLITTPLLGLGNLARRTQRQKTWKLHATEDSDRQRNLPGPWYNVLVWAKGMLSSPGVRWAQRLGRCLWQPERGEREATKSAPSPMSDLL